MKLAPTKRAHVRQQINAQTSMERGANSILSVEKLAGNPQRCAKDNMQTKLLNKLSCTHKL